MGQPTPSAQIEPAPSAQGDGTDLLDDGRLSGRVTDRTRTCIVSRAILPEADLIRFVAGPDGQIVPDLKRRLPGRGAWVRARYADVADAVRKRSFSRAFKGVGQASPDLPDRVGAAVRETALGGLGLARKAGLVVTGFAKVEAAIRKGRASAVLHASDAAENGVAKLQSAIRAAEADGHVAPDVVTDLPSGMLSMALGGAHVIHAALMRDDRSAAAGQALRRYRQFDAPADDQRQRDRAHEQKQAAPQ